MTQLTITPKVADKTARFKGTIAAGEHVAVTIKGGAEWIGTDNGANLTLRVLDLVTGRTLAVFPYWTEDNQEDWPEGLESADAWAPAAEDANDLYCELNLNTLRMVAAARHMLRVPVVFVLGDTDNPRTLYFRDRYEVEYWPERIGDTVPYDLDKWPKQIDEWTELVEGFGTRLDAAEEDIAAKGEAIDEAIDSIDGKVFDAVSTHLAGKKDVQTSVEDPDASGTSLTFIDTISQDTNGEIMPTKKSVKIDDVPTANSGNPVQSGGVKTALNAKYAKPQGGIPKSDLASAVQTSLGKADTALQAHQSLDAYVNGGDYDSSSKKILLKHGSTIIAEIDATDFIKDGMVGSVEITGGNLVISFNTDAGIEDIEIPLTDIFNPSNYYDKTAADGRFVQKETGKGLVTVDATLAVQGAAADAEAVGDALAGKLDGAAAYPAWSDEAAYAHGDIVSHVGRIWKCSDENVGGEPGVSGGWAETTIRELLAAKQNMLDTDQVNAINSGVTSAKVESWDGYAAQIAQKASLSDLPYALVEPGAWEFSDGLSYVIYGPDEVLDPADSSTFWVYTATRDETAYYSQEFSTEALARAALSLTLTSGSNSITATRPSLPGHLLDRAGNRVVVSGATTLTLPALEHAGRLRDFLVRLEIGGSTVPTITFAAPTGETIVYETDGDEFPVPDEAGTWSYSFTENCVAHKFAVSLKKVNTVAQGGS